MRIPQSLRTVGIGALVATTLAVVPLRAQQLTGRVLDSISGLPIPGAVVSIAGATDPIMRTVTGGDGRFTVFLRSDSRTLTVSHIGFTTRSLPLPSAPRLEESPIEVRLTRAPSRVAPLVSSGQVCAPSPTAVQAVGLWEQARSSFLASMVARQAAPARMRVLNYETIKGSASGNGPPGGGPAFLPRTPDNAVLVGTWSEQARVSSTAWIEWRPMDDVLTSGFVDVTRDSVRMFVPDVDVLLDSLFESTHCFSMVSPDSAGLAGIRVSATRDRGLKSEIVGTLWMSRSPLSVKALEYSYVGPGTFAGKQSGGRVTFSTAPNGIVLVDEWLIFHPGVLARADTADARAGPAGGRSSTPLAIRGSMLIAAEWGDGTRLVRPPIEVTGRVVERETGTPVVGATISLPLGKIQTVTARDGAFRFKMARPEQYLLSVADSSLAAFGVIRRDASTFVSLDTGRVAAVTVTIDRMIDVARPRCGMATLGRGEGVLLLRVVDSVGSPVEADIEYGFPRPEVAYKPAWGVSTARGMTAVCGVGADSLRVTAFAGDRRGVLDMRLTSTALDTVTITVRPVQRDTTSGYCRSVQGASATVCSRRRR